ncbi:MAG: hypothetical protein HAW66_00660 [Shewanella sp.]|nr:hypothetical protein [Shewanella sp.]
MTTGKIVGKRSSLFKSYSPKINDALVGKIQSASTASTEVDFPKLQSLIQRLMNWFVGVDSRTYMLPLLVLSRGNKQGRRYKKPNYSMCVAAMSRFNGLERVESKSGESGPKIVQKDTKVKSWQTIKERNFFLEYTDDRGEAVELLLCTVNMDESDASGLAIKKEIASQLSGTKSNNVSSIKPHALVSKADPQSFKDANMVYTLLNDLSHAQTDTQADKLIESLRDQTLDCQIRFKIRVNKTPRGYYKSYFVVFKDDSVHPLRPKLLTCDESTHGLCEDTEDAYLNKLKENVIVKEKHATIGHEYFCPNGWNG